MEERKSILKKIIGKAKERVDSFTTRHPIITRAAKEYATGGLYGATMGYKGSKVQRKVNQGISQIKNFSSKHPVASKVAEKVVDPLTMVTGGVGTRKLIGMGSNIINKLKINNYKKRGGKVGDFDVKKYSNKNISPYMPIVRRAERNKSIRGPL